MSLKRVLTEECTILTRTVDNTGKTAKETFTPQANPVKCRRITRLSHVLDPSNSQYQTRIRTRFMLPSTANVNIRDRLQHDGRRYEIVEEIPARAPSMVHHRVVICEVVV